MIETVLIVDVETTGLDPKTDRICEVGAALYSIKHRSVIATHSALCDTGTGNAAEAINRIPSAALLHGYTLGVEEALRPLRRMATWSEAFVAHRAPFDRGFVAEADERLAADRPWVCSKFDIEWKLGKPGASLVELALAYGVPVWQNHRALTDCLLLAHVFEAAQRGGEDVATMLVRAQRPKVRVVADVPRHRNDEVKAAGFRWDNDAREWWREMFADDVAALTFPHQVSPSAPPSP